MQKRKHYIFHKHDAKRALSLTCIAQKKEKTRRKKRERTEKKERAVATRLRRALLKTNL